MSTITCERSLDGGQPDIRATREDSALNVSRIAILNAVDDPRGSCRHMVGLLQAEWERMGVEVVHLYGTEAYVPADLLFVHVDRSRVDDSYGAFAARYPRAVNAAALDIRKRSYAPGLLERGADHVGPVIVKSNDNYAGQPERQAAYASRTLADRIVSRLRRLTGLARRPLMTSKQDYFVADSLQAVPDRFFAPEFVVQTFVPEVVDGKYHVREYYFLGDTHFENIERSEGSIFDEDEHVSLAAFEPHPDLLALRERLGLDYGKIDYVMVDGAPFVFDANKTPGVGVLGAAGLPEPFRAMARAMARSVLQAGEPEHLAGSGLMLAA